MNILFVCTGNICRSPMAEALLGHMLKKEGIKGVDIASRGVAAQPGRAMTFLALDVLREQGITGFTHASRPLTVQDLECADLVLVMEAAHREAINQRFPGFSKKIHLLKVYAGVAPGESQEVDDPYGGSREDYERCRMEIQDSLLAILSKLKNSGGRAS